MIQLNKADFEKMLAHATRELPDEACGLIAGEVQDRQEGVPADEH